MRINLRHIVYVIFLGLSHLTFAQSTTIQTDRPDQTESPFVTPHNYIQIETGIMSEEVNSDEHNVLLPTTLLKYGLNERFEFRLIADVLSKRTTSESSFGLSPLTIGFKANLFHERGFIPEIAFIGHVSTTKVGSTHLHNAYPAPSFRFTMQHAITNKLNIGYNLGAEWDGETANPTYIYTLTSGVSIYKGLSGFLELYGFIPMNAISDHRIDGGITYLIGNDFQLDISGGIGTSSLAPRYFISGGISYRFRLRK